MTRRLFKKNTVKQLKKILVDHPKWYGTTGRGSKKAGLSGFDLSEFDLSGFVLLGVNLYDARLSGVNLEGAGANLFQTNLCDAKMQICKIPTLNIMPPPSPTRKHTTRDIKTKPIGAHHPNK